MLAALAPRGAGGAGGQRGWGGGTLLGLGFRATLAVTVIVARAARRALAAQARPGLLAERP